MNRFFNNDNPLLRIMGTVFDLIVLNVLTLLCCIPIFTAGASFSAMHYVLIHIVRGEETYIAREFFAAFKENFKQATLAWLAFLVIIALGVLDVLYVRSLEATSSRWILIAAVAFVGVTVYAIWQYFFPLVARYSNSTKTHLLNAVSLSVAYLPRTLLMLIINGAVAALAISYWIYAVPLILLLGLTAPQVLCAYVYNPILLKLEEK